MEAARRNPGRPRQDPGQLRADFDRLADLSDDGWDHNAHYHGFLLGQLPSSCGQALDVGCGTGAFARRLAGRCDRVLAIDLARCWPGCATPSPPAGRCRCSTSTGPPAQPTWP